MSTFFCSLRVVSAALCVSVYVCVCSVRKRECMCVCVCVCFFLCFRERVRAHVVCLCVFMNVCGARNIPKTQLASEGCSRCIKVPLAPPQSVESPQTQLASDALSSRKVWVPVFRRHRRKRHRHIQTPKEVGVVG
jgi:hypothetical protein